MTTKLTLTLEKEVIEKAKKYASENGRSLSEMVENYFKLLVMEKKDPSSKISNRVKRLQGIIKVDSTFDYKKTLEEEIIKRHL